MTSTAATEPGTSGPSWNPLRCGGTALPPHVLLAAKLMAVFFLVRYAERYGSFWGMQLGSLPLEVAFLLTALRWVANIVAPLAAVLLLFNRGVRVMSFACGLAAGFEFALHRIGSADLFFAVFLLLAAFEANVPAPRWLRYLVVFTYLFGGLAWLLGPLPQFKSPNAGAGDPVVLRGEIPVAIKLAFPPAVLPAVASWVTALVVFLLAAVFALPRCWPLAIWAGIVFHCFFRDAGDLLPGAYTMLASYLVFADWPETRLTVLYDGDCGFCNKTREWISRFDLERLYDWQPYQSGAGDAFGISVEALERRAHVVSPHGVDSGFQAFRMMALYNPLTYFGLAAVAIAVHPAAPLVQNIVLAALILGFSPLVRPIGELVYDWVSRNRHRLPPRGCKIPD
jgi:predicted DCC family thiol-disulfide oxidoreductase YuxK